MQNVKLDHFSYIWEWQSLKPDNANYWQGCKGKKLSHSADGKINLYKHKEKPMFCKLDCVYLTISHSISGHISKEILIHMQKENCLKDGSLLYCLQL